MGRQLGIPHRMLNVAVPEPRLQRPRIVPQLVTAAVPQHMGMNREGHAGPFAEVLDQGMEDFRRHRRGALGYEHVRGGPLFALQAAQRPQLIALQRMHARRPALAAADMEPARGKLGSCNTSEWSERSAYGGTHRLEVTTRSRSAPHADQRHPTRGDSGPPTIHQHLAPLPQCRDGTMENSCQPFVGRALSSLSSVELVDDPGMGGVWGCAGVNDGPIATENRVSHLR